MCGRPRRPCPSCPATSSGAPSPGTFRPGATYVLTTSYRFRDTNTFALYAQIDTDNSVTETNELNNVLGPVAINVQSSGIFQQATHRDFQYGMASGLDLSHPDGVITLGSFEEPWQDAGLGATSVYSPDVMINDVIAGFDGETMLPTTVEQVRPSIVADSGDGVYSVWQDGRHGGTYNNRIYFAASTDRGATWSPNISITADIPVTTVVNQMAPRIGYDNALGRISVVWQDNRRGHYDIWYSSSDDSGATWAPSTRVNDDTVNANAQKLQPSLVISDGGAVYVAWQDQRNGNDDIYMTRSEDGGATWPFQNTFVTDDPETTVQAQRSPSIGLGHALISGQPAGLRRLGRTGAIPCTPRSTWPDSVDGGSSFGVDVPVVLSWRPELPGGAHHGGHLAHHHLHHRGGHPGDLADQDRHQDGARRPDPPGLAGRQGRERRRILCLRLAAATIRTSSRTSRSRRGPLTFSSGRRSRSTGSMETIATRSRLKPSSAGPLEPTWQGEVTMARADGYSYRCVPEDITYGGGVYIAWSDGRGFDRDRRDVYVARVAHVVLPNEDIKSHIWSFRTRRHAA